MKFYSVSGVAFKVVAPEPCLRLVQYGKGAPITCACSACAARNQTPAEALASVLAAHGG